VSDSPPGAAVSPGVSIVDRLLLGAIDVHCHGYPELSLEQPTRVDDVENCRRMAAAGMRAVVIKSHLWPTMGRVYHLRERVPEIEIFGSITLNACVGGLDPWIVEAAAGLGARMVWMPTWTTRHDLERNGAVSHLHRFIPATRVFGPERGVTILDESGHILPAVADVLRAAQAHNLPVSTGHLAPRESLALAETANALGFDKLLFGHPDAHSVGADLETIQQMVAAGAYLELTALGTLPALQRIHPRTLLEWARAVGVDRCVLTTDYFFDWVPPAVETLRMFIGSLVAVGATEDEIATMARRNPARLLGLAEG
jgi:hypothetical protein